MKFRCNGSKWIIKEVSKEDIYKEVNCDGTMGITKYTEQEIWLLDNQKNKEKTLKHELVHVWLYENGHSQKEDKDFGYESVCEIVACSNDFINEIIAKYFNITTEVLYCDNKEVYRGVDSNNECE